MTPSPRETAYLCTYTPWSILHHLASIGGQDLVTNQGGWQTRWSHVVSLTQNSSLHPQFINSKYVFPSIRPSVAWSILVYWICCYVVWLYIYYIVLLHLFTSLSPHLRVYFCTSSTLLMPFTRLMAIPLYG